MIALIGYRFGGGVGVEFGSTGAPLVANVSIHGSFRDHHTGWAKNAKGMYLILHGAEDQGFPLPVVDKVVQELRGAKVPFQLEVYSGTGHGFSTPKNKDEERANAQSIASTGRTLKELSASERGGSLRSSSHERVVRLIEDQFVHRPVGTAAEFYAEALKLG